MIYDIVFLVSDRKLKTKEEKINTPQTEFYRVFIRKENFLKLQILKDPIEDHMTTYLVEFINLDKDLIDYFKNNIVESIVIRIGKLSDDKIPNYNLLKLYIKPIKITIPEPKKSTVNNVVVTGISNNNYLLMLDKTFSTTLNTSNISATESTNTGYSSNAQKVSGSYNFTAKVSGKVTRNVLNYNPGNLIDTNIAWKGVIGAEAGFEKFATPELGFRALALNLKNKMNKGMTLQQIIYSWAPPHENNSAAYALFVSKQLGVGLNQQITDADIANMAKFISWYEGDNQVGFYTDQMINDGVAQAGINSTTTYASGPKVKSNLGNQELMDAINSNIEVQNPATVSQSTYGNTTQSLSNNMLTGANYLRNILSALNAKYDIMLLNDPLAVGGESNFVYENVYAPNLDAYNLIKHIYEWYPPLYLNSPWIIDDAYYTDDKNHKIGQSVFIPLNLFNIAALPTPELNLTSFILSSTGVSYVSEIFNVIDVNKYYKDYDLQKFKALCYNHRCLIDNKETIITPNETNFEVLVPTLDENNSDNITSNKKIINVAETLNIETNYDAVEFKKRLTFLEQHMESEPELIFMKIVVNDLNYFQFGKKYYLTNDSNDTPLTPYKILQTFTNVKGFLKLDYDILFFKSSLDLNTTV